MNWRIPLYVLVAMLLATATLLAAPPGMMNYQGRLTDDSGDPVENGSYTLTFTIYDESDAVLWTESQKPSVSDGLFRVMLGDDNPLTADIFDHAECWLGVTLDGDPEMTPRTRLITSPYSFRTATVDGAAGGDISSDLSIDGDLSAGNTDQSGNLYLYGEASENPMVSIKALQGMGGSLSLHNETGYETIALQPDASGPGGYFAMRGDGGSTAFYVDGNYGGSGDPFMGIYGSGSASYFATDVTGDISVILPEGSVNSTEIKDEPGLAGSANVGSYYLSEAMSDAVTLSIAIPDDGYIFLLGKGYFHTYGSTDANFMYAQIGEDQGGISVAPYKTCAGMAAYGNSGSHMFPFFVQRAVYKSAGTYTFRLEASASNPAHTSYVVDPMLTAVFLPTGYGVVTSFVSDPGGFEQATPVLAEASEEQPGSGEQMYEVDLRELELRASRLKAEALEAELALRDAQSLNNGTELE